jgi:hypothetical protein
MQVLAAKVEHDEFVHNGLDQIHKKLASLQATIEQQTSTINAQAKEIKKLKEKPSVVNNVTININNWETPDVRFLTEKNTAGVSKIVEMIHNKMVGAPLALVREVWFNPATPANHAIYLTNKLTGEVLAWDGRRWRADNIKQVSGRLRDRAYGWTNHVGVLVKNPQLMQQIKINHADTELLTRELNDIRNIVYEGRDVVRSGRGGVPRI